MSDLSPLLLAAPAIALGAAAAHLVGPMAWNWPHREGGVFHRLSLLPRGGRPLAPRVLGGAFVALLLVSGALAAYAAEPAAPPRAAGVVVSTDASKPAVASQGGASPTRAPAQTILASAGSSARTLSGIPASPAPAEAPTILTLSGVPDEATALRIIQEQEALKAGTGWAFVPYHPVSVTDAEARRVLAYAALTELARSRGISIPISDDTLKAVWSQAGYDDYMAINAKLGAAANAAKAAGQTVASVSYLPNGVALSPAFRTSTPLPAPGTVIPPRFAGD